MPKWVAREIVTLESCAHISVAARQIYALGIYYEICTRSKLLSLASDFAPAAACVCVLLYHGNLERALTFFYFAADYFACAAEMGQNVLIRRVRNAFLLRRTQINKKRLFSQPPRRALQSWTLQTQNFAHFWCSLKWKKFLLLALACIQPPAAKNQQADNFSFKLFSSISLCFFLSFLDSRQNRWPGEEKWSAPEIFDARVPKHTHLYTFYILRPKFTRGNESRDVYANCERTGRAGCISGPPKARTPAKSFYLKRIFTYASFSPRGHVHSEEANKFTLLGEISHCSSIVE